MVLWNKKEIVKLNYSLNEKFNINLTPRDKIIENKWHMDWVVNVMINCNTSSCLASDLKNCTIQKIFCIVIYFLYLLENSMDIFKNCYYMY